MTATDAAALARAIEHTQLVAQATPEDIERLCGEASRHGFHAVCVNPCYVSLASRLLRGESVRVVSVAAFPLGASVPAVAAREAATALNDGAHEVDFVVPIGAARAGELGEVTRAVETVRRSTAGSVLKVILETGHFAEDSLTELADAVLQAEPDFLKTSTGFGPRGATVEDVRLLVRVAAGRAQVKAAGGIRTAADARALLDAGATRLGTSAGVTIVGGAS